ncbi:MAG: hypothetical protein ACNA8K_15580 [Cyclonatronaceae bacterium]
MLATERGALTNSLWRELLDYLPVPALLFRIEENDHARLMFANRDVETVLGYTPGEYVLESESEGRVQQELNTLVDRIAELSHSGNDHGRQQCELTGKFGSTGVFGFGYRIFKSKTANHHFIVVTLYTAGPATPAGTNVPSHLSDRHEFIADSAVMQGAMNKASFIASQPVHGWVMGEKGTGRTTVALRIAQMIEARTGNITMIPFHRDNGADLPAAERLPDSGMVVMVLDDADKLQASDFDRIKKSMEKWEAEEYTVKVIVTASATPEQMHAEGQLPGSWIYGMTFGTVLLPPLKQRGHDIERIALSFMKKASEVLGIREPVWDETAAGELLKYEWPGNIEELHAHLRRLLLAGSGSTIRPGKKDEKKLPMGERKEEFQVIPFEEMSARYLRRVLEHTEGKIYGKDGAAALLDLKPTTLQSKLIKLGVR